MMAYNQLMNKFQLDRARIDVFEYFVGSIHWI